MPNLQLQKTAPCNIHPNQGCEHQSLLPVLVSHHLQLLVLVVKSLQMRVNMKDQSRPGRIWVMMNLGHDEAAGLEWRLELILHILE